jgi:hypothetical protein
MGFGSVKRLVNVSDTATILRRSMLGLAAAGILATAGELATLRHWTTTLQLIPWFVLAVCAIGVLIIAFGGSRQMIRVVRFICIAGVVGGLYGVFDHIKENYDAAILDYHYTDRWPHMSLISKLWAAGSGSVGPAPVLAPAVLTQIALCMALATLHHPKLVGAGHAAPAVARATLAESAPSLNGEPMPVPSTVE